MKIKIDYRENKTPKQKQNIERFKREFGAENIDIVPLETGDIIVKQEDGLVVCVERKTILDFASSCISRHMQNQALRMAEEFDFRAIIIVGKFDEIRNNKYLRDKFSKKHFYSNVVSLILRYKTPVIWVETEMDLIKTLNSIVNSLSKDEPLEKPTIIENTGNPIRDIISCVPGIGKKKAEAILNHFGSLRAIMDASEKDLMEIRGVGKKQSSEIKRWLK